MFPTTQLDLVTELFVNDDWADVSADVWLGNDVTITHGRPNESGRVNPSACSFTLKNTSGNYSPRNPTGIYYGSLGRNTPVRMAVRHVTDAFTRTVANGWGSTTGGSLAWTVVGTASNYAATGTTATHVTAAADTRRYSYLADLINYRNYEVRVDISLSPTAPASGTLKAGIMLRGQTTTGPVNYAVVEVDVTSASVVRLAIRDSDDATLLYGPATVAGVTVGTYTLAAQVEGTTIRAKLWNAANPEPYAWQATAVSDTMARAGWLGIRSLSGGSATTTTFTYDNVEVRSPRFFGEASVWPPRWDQSANRALVPVEAGGLLRRLQQGDSPTQSALLTYFESGAGPTPVAYWPLEDGATSTTGAPAVVDSPSMVPFGYAQPEFGAVPGLPGSRPLPDLRSKSALTAQIVDSVDTDAWQVEIWFRTDTGSSTGFTAVVPVQWDMSGSIPAFDVLLFIGEGAGGDGVGTIGFDIAAYEAYPPVEANRSTDLGIIVGSVPNVQGSWRQLRVCMQQTTATVVVLTAYLDGVLLGTATDSPWNLGTPTRVVINPTQDAPGVNAYAGVDGVGISSAGHLAVYNTIADPGDYDAGRGFPGETAGRRMERLCSENGVPFEYLGDLDATAAMGPQTVATLMELIAECADVDLGSLYEPRGTLGIGYRTRESLYNQASTLALTLTSGHLSAPIEPVDDDQATRNDVTVTRTGGGTYRGERTDGPLSVSDPQDGGVGRYDESLTLNVETDDQLSDIVWWLIHLGTVDTARYPQIRFDLAMTAYAASPALTASAFGLGADDRITVVGLANLRIYEEITQLARGMTETIGPFTLDIAINCAPETPYQVGVVESTTLGRLDSDASTLAEDLTTTETGADVAISDGCLWTTTGAQFPFDIVVGGEHLTVTAISGASTPQTFTVTRSVNGVIKTHSTGAAVSLLHPAVLAL